VPQQQWRRKVRPDCLAQAQEAVARLRAQAIDASLVANTWLVFDLMVYEGADLDAMVARKLDRVWPHWRDCVTAS
jgi:hypothetical protein